MSRKITIVEVARDIDVEMTNREAWSIGAAVRTAYENRTGYLPDKELRQKTAGGGTHCFAVYPPTMRKEIEKIIRAHMPKTSRQGSLL